MAAITFQIDEATGKKLDALAIAFGVPVRSEVLRRCIALGQVAVEMADKDGSVTFKNGAREKIVALSR
jgi:predicted transcriptional regulator